MGKLDGLTAIASSAGEFGDVRNVIPMSASLPAWFL